MSFPQSYAAKLPIPEEARLLAPESACDFVDCRGVSLPGSLTALQAWNAVMAQPVPGLTLAFRVRDWISARFGVKQIGGFTGEPKTTVQAGEKLDFFLVEEASDARLLLSERDRHLDVLTCVTATPEPEGGTRVTITSSVVTHNRFGRAYMLPVGPGHKLLVSLMLRRLRKSVAQIP